eukprot:scaffold30205_cov67-Isochrysis_galbana.AAC.1
MGEEQGAAEGREARCASGGDGDVSDDETSDASESAGAGSSGEGVGVLPAGLLFALQVVGMENTDEGPVLSLDELDLLTSTLEHRLRGLAPTEAEDAGAWGKQGQWEGGSAALLLPLSCCMQPRTLLPTRPATPALTHPPAHTSRGR